MTMNPKKYCISLDLAKRLSALGMKKESMFYWCYTEAPLKDGTRWELRYNKQISESWWELGGEALPAYTSGELGEMLRVALKQLGNRTVLNIPQARVRQLFSRVMNGIPKNEVEDRAKMLIYLIENGLLDVKLLDNNKDNE